MKTWFITGASRGFGALIAARALAEGDNVVASARDPKTVTAKLGEHERLLAVRLDVTREEEAKAAVEAAVARFGRIDVLVNNAGYGLLAAVEEATAPEVEKLFATNVFGLLAVTRAVLPVMRRQRAGHVISISSIGGYAAYQGWGVYGASKFAVEGLSEAMSQELAPLGIRATVVEPGFFRTDFLDAQSLEIAAPIEDYAATVGAMRGLMQNVHGAQPGDPAKLAEAMIALAKAPEPPVRLPLGTDTLARLAAKNRSVDEEMARWHELAASTDFPA